jgi:hypothetical protein
MGCSSAASAACIMQAVALTSTITAISHCENGSSLGRMMLGDKKQRHLQSDIAHTSLGGMPGCQAAVIAAELS